MTLARRWLVPAVVGLVSGLLVYGYWPIADRITGPCHARACYFPVEVGTWLVGAVVVPLVGWALLAIAGRLWMPVSRRAGWLWASSVAVAGSAVLGLGIRVYDGFVYGSPRPPLAVLLLMGGGGFLIAAGRRWSRFVAAGVIVALVVTLVVTPNHDRLHRFASLAAVGRLPDPARWRVTAAEAYPHYNAIELDVTPVAGGPAVALIEVPIPGNWGPTSNCGAALVALRYAIATETAAVDADCAVDPSGGWRRAYPNGEVELLELQAGALILTGSADVAHPARPATQRDLLADLTPATPTRMAALPTKS